MRHHVFVIIFLSLSVICWAQEKVPEAYRDFYLVYSQELDPRYGEYNFWNGHWDVTWKSWKERDEYTTTGKALHKVFSALDGKALIELAYSDEISGGSKTAGFSIRYFDETLQKWVMLQSWPGRNATNISSLMGTHHHGRIQVYQSGKTSGYRYAPPGTPYVNRYTFSDVSPDSFRWDSSISIDSMRTWHTGSIAEFNRIEDFRSLKDESTNNWYTYGDGYNCDDSLLNDLRPYIGEWEGMAEHYQNGKKYTSRFKRVLMPFLSNCGLFGYQIVEEEERVYKEILFATYLVRSGQWVLYSLNNKQGESQVLYTASDAETGELVFRQEAMFGVPASNPVKVRRWKISGNRQASIQAFDENGISISEALLTRMTNQ